jgi:ribonuclease D
VIFNSLIYQRPMDAGMLQYATFDVLFLRILAATMQVTIWF